MNVLGQGISRLTVSAELIRHKKMVILKRGVA